VDEGGASSGCPSPPGCLCHPQDAAHLLQVQAPAFGGSLPGSSPSTSQIPPGSDWHRSSTGDCGLNPDLWTEDQSPRPSPPPGHRGRRGSGRDISSSRGVPRWPDRRVLFPRGLRCAPWGGTHLRGPGGEDHGVEPGFFGPQQGQGSDQERGRAGGKIHDSSSPFALTDPDKSRISRILLAKEEGGKESLASDECALTAADQDHLLHADKSEMLSPGKGRPLILLT